MTAAGSPIDSGRLLQTLGAYADNGPDVVQAKLVNQAAVDSAERIGLLALFDSNGNPMSLAADLERILAPTSLNATVADLNGIAVNSFAQAGTTVAEWTTVIPSTWATFNILIRYASTQTTGNIVARPDRAFLAVGDAMSVATGTAVTIPSSTVANTIREATLASGVSATVSKHFHLRITRLGDDALDTMAGAMYISSVILRKAS